MCSRQYFWRYVADVPSSPPSDTMIRGTAIHNVMEKGLLEGYDAVEQAAIDNDVVFDSAIDSLTSLIDQIADHFGKLDVVEAEVNAIKDNKLAMEFIEDYQGKEIKITSGEIIKVLKLDEYIKFADEVFNVNGFKAYNDHFSDHYPIMTTLSLVD